MRDSGAAALAAALPASRLRQLNLSKCDIHDDGAAALAAALPVSRLEGLCINHNSFGEGGALAFSAALPACTLLEDLIWTHLSASGEELTPSRRAADEAFDEAVKLRNRTNGEFVWKLCVSDY